MGTLRILKLKKRFSEISKLSPTEIKDIQKQNIRRLLRHAVSTSPFYSKLYGATDVNELLRKDFSSLPTTNKQMIMDSLDEVITYPHVKRKALEHHLSTTQAGTKYLNEFTVIHTSGSSGRIGLFTYDSLAWDTLKAMVLARCTNFQVRIPRMRMAFVGITDGHYAGVTIASDVPRLLAAYEHVSVNEPIASMVQRLNRFQPDDLRGYPTGLSMLAREKLAGRLDISPKKIVSSAEPLDDTTRNIVQEAFGITPYNFYAASEAIGMAQDCSEHQGLHVFNDNVIIEIVDDDGNPVQPGESGHVVLTNLFNLCQPLIPYQMKDIAAYAEEPCDCGSPFPLLKSISGRSEEVLWVEDGKGRHEALHPSVFIEFFVPGLRRLQVHQRERNRLKLHVVAEGDIESILTSVEERMNRILAAKKLQEMVSFEVEFVDSILPDPRTGKTRTVVSKVGSPKEV